MIELFEQSGDPIERLDAARRIREAAQDLESLALAAAREAGATWKGIGDCYGLSKQGAQQRFGRSVSSDLASTDSERKKKRPDGGYRGSQ